MVRDVSWSRTPPTGTTPLWPSSRASRGLADPRRLLHRRGRCVDVEGMRLGKDWHPRKRWPRGVLPAISDWLAGPGHDFVVRRDLELYGMTCHPRWHPQRFLV